MKNSLRISIFIGLSILFFSCGRPQSQPAVSEIDNPAGPSSHLPYLATDQEGNTFLSWVENMDSSTVELKYARLNGDSWSSPSAIAQGSDWFVNWADFPSIAAENGNLRAAHWLHKIPGNAYSYEVRLSMARSRDKGWSPALTPHADQTATEHGFVSMIPWGDDRILAIWLDGRRTAGRADDEYGDLSKAMTLRSALVSADGSVSERALVDGSVCDCCQTSLAETPGGAVAAYRGRTEDEIRDIYISRYRDGRWSEPAVVHDDNWEIAACPVNGPAVAASNDRILVAWFTGADETYRVKAAFSSGGGESFSEPIQIDEGNPLGRVDAAFLDSGTAVVSWMEKTDGGAELKVRLVRSDTNTAGDPVTIIPMDPARSSGFPQMAVDQQRLLFAWTQTGEPSRIRTAFLPLSSLN